MKILELLRLKLAKINKNEGPDKVRGGSKKCQKLISAGGGRLLGTEEYSFVPDKYPPLPYLLFGNFSHPHPTIGDASNREICKYLLSIKGIPTIFFCTRGTYY